MHRGPGPALVAVAYYLGAQIGFALQSPNVPQSVLWLPNSILLGVLLIVPPRTWPVYLASCYPAQMLTAWQTGAPPVTLSLLFVTNCADATLGAFLVRRLASDGGPFQFTGLRGTIVFAALGAALPTLLLSFADAGISVGTAWSGDFHAAFVTRVRSNVLTHLLVVPALVDLSAVHWRRLRRRDAVEVAVLTVAVVLTCAAVFSLPTSSRAFPAVLYVPLALLLWAAVRFGPGGVGWSVLLVAGAASWEALRGHGPFTARPAVENVVSLQLFLLAAVVPLLFLAAVVRERNRAMYSVRTSATALRRSYARVRRLAGKLIAAQESERARVARDLHDDFNQQLAALSIGIGGARQRAGGDAALAGLLGTLQDQTVALTDQVRIFSHELHPRMLEHVGLSAALRTHSAQLAEHRLQVRLTVDGALDGLPPDVALCAYRVVQEALRNVLLHAGVGEADVSVVRSGRRLDVTIRDNGCGFAPDSPDAHGGLGLLSMEERARLADGACTITSVPGHGTTVHVYIPVRPA